MTFILVSVGWIFFRANSISDALTLFEKLFTVHVSFGEAFDFLGLSTVNLLLIISAFLVLLILDNLVTYEGEGDGSDSLVLGGSFIYVIWVILIIWLLLFSKDMISTFIYFAF